jgi:hypothetical protein
MIQCIQYYLANGLQKQNHKNLELRKLIGETSNEFYEWAVEDGNLTIDERHYNTEIFNKFTDEYQDMKGRLLIRTFKKWCKAYAANNGLSYIESHSNSMRYFILSKSNVEIEKKDDTLPF